MSHRMTAIYELTLGLNGLSKDDLRQRLERIRQIAVESGATAGPVVAPAPPTRITDTKVASTEEPTVAPERRRRI